MKNVLWLILVAALAISGCGGDDSTTPNNHPQITAGPAAVSATIAENETTIVSVTATDANGDDLTYAWSSDNGTFAGSGSLVVYQPGDVLVDTVQTITVVVSDGKGGSATGTIEVTVQATTVIGATYQVRLNSLTFVNADCDGFLDSSLEAFWNIAANTVSSVRTEGNYQSASTGINVVITTDWSQADVLFDGTGAITVTGTLSDYDSTSANDLIGSWNLSYNTANITAGNFSVSGGNPAGEGCNVVLNFTIEYVGDVNGTP